MRKDQEKILKSYKDYIFGVVQSKSAACIPSELIDLVKNICESDGIKVCTHCSGSLYNAFKYVKQKYLD